MNRKLIFALVNVAIFVTLGVLVFIFLEWFIEYYFTNFVFWLVLVLGLLLDNEFWHWVKKSKRNWSTDLIFIVFTFALMMLFTNDLFIAFLGAFAVYLSIGSLEYRGHKVINKILLISTITYDTMFVIGIIDFVFNTDWLNKFFAISIWFILFLGLVLFGRKYIVVLRFVSPQYIQLAFYLLSWIIVASFAFIAQYDIFQVIYPALLITNLVIYLSSGFFINKFLGIKPVKKIEDNERRNTIVQLVESAKEKIKYKAKVKIGYANYPIINAFAYGSIFDKRISIIAPEGLTIPEHELEAIIAHELGHLKSWDPTWLLLLNLVDLVIRWIFQIPATYYDFAFGKTFTIAGIDLGIGGFIVFNLLIVGILYIFVRMMEARTDNIVKKAMMGEELAKALYNLESFYALGRQSGINVMLLAEEKLDENHEMMNYISAARTIFKRLQVPTKLMAISSFLTSHPYSFLRIANMLLDKEKEYTPWEETVIPYKFLKKSNRTTFNERVATILDQFQTISLRKFKELFGYTSDDEMISLVRSLQLDRSARKYVGNQVLYTNKVTGITRYVTMKKIEFQASIAEPFKLVGKLIQDDGEITISPGIAKLEIMNLGETYELKGKGKWTLKGILDNCPVKKMKCVLENSEGKQIETPLKAIKNQVTHESILRAEGNAILIEENETVRVFHCNEIKGDKRLSEYLLEVETFDSGDELTLPLDQYSVTRDMHAFMVYKDEKYKRSYVHFLEWCKQNEIWLTFILKKPVNNDYTAIVLDVDSENWKIVIKDVFGENEEFKLDEVDLIYLYTDLLILKSHKQKSILQKLARRLAEHRRSTPWIPA